MRLTRASVEVVKLDATFLTVMGRVECVEPPMDMQGRTVREDRLRLNRRFLQCKTSRRGTRVSAHRVMRHTDAFPERAEHVDKTFAHSAQAHKFQSVTSLALLAGMFVANKRCLW